MNDDTVPEPAVADGAVRGVVSRALEHSGTIIAPDRIAHLRERIAALSEWGRARGWIGPDPYEGLNARRLAFLGHSPLGRRVLIQAVKRSPVDLRRPLGIAPELDAASVAHVLAASTRLTGRGLATAPGVEWGIDRLLELRSAAVPEPSWGYHFDVETRFFFYPRTTPNTIATAFAGQALLDAHELTGRADLLELAGATGDFFLERVGLTGEGSIGYFPGDRTPIHNATALAAAFLARAGSLAGRSDLTGAARTAIGFVVASQRPDGAWRYAEGDHGDWVDGLHTGYVLDSVRMCAATLADDALAAAHAHGIAYYRDHLFLKDGTPKFYDDRVQPVDAQSAAQAIRTFAGEGTARSLELAWRVYGYAVARLDRGDGSFAFQRHRRRVDRTPHVRWVQAPMLDALARLLIAAGD